MKRLLILLPLTWLATPAMAQHEGHSTEEPPPSAPQSANDPHAGHETHDSSQEEEQVTDPHARHDVVTAPRAHREAADPHAAHDMSAGPDSTGEIPDGAPPPGALTGPRHAADALFDPRQMAAAREQLRAEEGGTVSYLVLADRFEASGGNGDEKYLWDLQGWYGGDINKLWLKTGSEGAFGDSARSLELQALYSRAVTPYFDFQAGIRQDLRPNPDRTYLVLGLQGLLPYVFELEAAAFLSDTGDLTGRLEVEYDLQIRQRLVLQPRVELNVSAQAVPELNIGSGVGSVEAGLRLRYEIRRELAPYLGIGWERKLGETGDFSRAAGEDRHSWGAVVGVRSWF